jgi:hypothetical protein
MTDMKLPTPTWKPGVPKFWLHLVSGLTWSGIGIWLCVLAVDWLKGVDLLLASILALGGLMLAGLIHLFGFTRFAKTNLERIDSIASDKVCIFAFQAWTSYPLVLAMISLGIFLRKYSPIPKHLLAVLYLGIGGGLFLSSMLYYRHLTHEHRRAGKLSDSH